MNPGQLHFQKNKSNVCFVVNVQEWRPHCTGMVAKFLFVSKCPGIGAALYRNGIISILFSTIQLFKIES